MSFPSGHVRITRYKSMISFPHSQCTMIATSSVTGLPIPLSAVHLYSPSFCLPVIVKGKDTELLSETFVQVIFGAGKPSAVQFRLTLSPLFSVWLSEMDIISGISLKGEKNVHNHEYDTNIAKTME